jgi:hypothetical protein
MKMKNLIFTIGVLFLSFSKLFSQLPTNLEATEIIKGLGDIIVNYPLDELTKAPSNTDIYIYDRLRANYYIDLRIVDKYYYATKKSNLNEFVTYTDENSRRYMIACALVKPVEVTEVKYNQTARNAFVFKCVFQVINQSRLGYLMNKYTEGELVSANLEFEQTSNGWSMIDSGKSYLFSNKNSCYYCQNAKNNLELKEEIAENSNDFYFKIDETILGKWRGKLGIFTFTKDGFSLENKEKIRNGKYEFKLAGYGGNITSCKIILSFDDKKESKYTIKNSSKSDTFLMKDFISPMYQEYTRIGYSK